MKTRFTLLFLAFIFGASAQLRMKTVEKSDGSYTYCYHSNGKESTVEFRPISKLYGAQGFSKAYDKTGKLIYDANSSRSGVLSGTGFSYYENGAVKVAEYSSHPDAGIQWYKKTTYFDENGIITSEFEMSDDMRVTMIQDPDTSYLRLERERKKLEEQKKQDKLKMECEQFVKDSAAFFITSKQELEDGTLLEFIPDPKNGTRQQVISKSGKTIKITTEHFVKTNGIQSIVRTYHKNRRIHEEFIYEEKIWHYREYDKKGILILEKLNQKN